jgi:transcription elongation factor
MKTISFSRKVIGRDERLYKNVRLRRAVGVSGKVKNKRRNEKIIA